MYFVRREGGAACGGKSYEVIIRGDWKLMQNDPFSPLELYNLKTDPQEKTNLAAANKKIFNQLATALRAHIQRGARRRGRSLDTTSNTNQTSATLLSNQLDL